MALLLNDLTESKRTGVWLYRNKNQNSQTPSCSSDPFVSSFPKTLFSTPRNIFQGREVTQILPLSRTGLKKNGEPYWNRTSNLLIKSRLSHPCSFNNLPKRFIFHGITFIPFYPILSIKSGKIVGREGALPLPPCVMEIISGLGTPPQKIRGL